MGTKSFLLLAACVLVLTAKAVVANKAKLVEDVSIAEGNISERYYYCASPTTLVCGSDVSASITTATTPDADSLTDGFRDHWFQLVGQGYSVTVHTCFSYTNFDTAVSVYTGSCSSLLYVTMNDQDYSCRVSPQTSNNARVTWTAALGTLYRIRVRGYQGTYGNYRIAVVNCPTPSPSPSPSPSKSPTPSPTPSPSVGPDACASPKVIACGSSVIGQLHTATANDLDSITDGYRDNWYSITVAQATIISASTCHTSTNFDNYLGLYDGNCSALNLLTYTGSSYKACPLTASSNYPALMPWIARPGTLYRIRVFSYYVGYYGLSITCSPVPSPSVDYCATPQAVTCGSSVIGSLLTASSQDSNSLTDGHIDQWYSITLAQNTIISMSTCHSATDFDAELNVFRGDCQGLNRTEGYVSSTKCNHFAYSSSFAASTTWMARAGVVYRIRVHGYSVSGNYGLDIACSSPPPVGPDSCSVPKSVSCGSTETESLLTATAENSSSIRDDYWDQWHSILLNETAIVTIKQVGNFSGPRPSFGIYRGNCSSLKAADANIDFKVDLVSYVNPVTMAATWMAQEGVLYRIRVYSSRYQLVTYGLDVSCVPVSSPGPDLYASLGIVSCGSVVSGSLLTATSEDPDAPINRDGPDHWYSLKLNQTTIVSLHDANQVVLTWDFEILSVNSSQLGWPVVYVGTDFWYYYTSIYMNSAYLHMPGLVSWIAHPGVEYRIRVFSQSQYSLRNYSFSTNCVSSVIPGKDTCEGAQPVSPGDVVSGNTLNATLNDPAYFGCRNHWYLVSVSQTSIVTVDACSSSASVRMSQYLCASWLPDAVYYGYHFYSTIGGGCKASFVVDRSHRFSIHGSSTTGNYNASISSVPISSKNCTVPQVLSCGDRVQGSVFPFGVAWYSIIVNQASVITITMAKEPWLWEFYDYSHHERIEVFNGNCSGLNSVSYDVLYDWYYTYYEEGSLSWTAQPQTTYRMQIQSYASPDSADIYTLTINCSVAPTPTPYPDLCSNPESLACGMAIRGTLQNATSLDPDSLSDGMKDQWHSIEVDEDTLITVSNCHSGANYSVSLNVYQGECVGLALMNSNQYTVSCERCAYSYGTAVSWVARQGVVYRIRAYNSQARTGYYGLNISCGALPSPGPDACENPETISCGSVVTGSLLMSTSSHPDSLPDDWYSIQVNESTLVMLNQWYWTSEFNILVSSDNCSGSWNNYPSEGFNPSVDYTKRIWMASAGVEYRIRIIPESIQTLGSYRFNVSCTPTPSPGVDMCEGAQPLGCNMVVAGNTLNATFLNPYYGNSRIHWYLLTSGSSVMVNVIIDICASSAWLELFTEDCDSVYSRRSTDDEVGCKRSLALGPNGFYLAQVQRYSAGPYNISTSCVTVGSELCSSAEAISCGDTVMHAMYAGFGYGSNWYSIVVDQPSNITATTCITSDGGTYVYDRMSIKLHNGTCSGLNLLPVSDSAGSSGCFESASMTWAAFPGIVYRLSVESYYYSLYNKDPGIRYTMSIGCSATPLPTPTRSPSPSPTFSATPTKSPSSSPSRSPSSSPSRSPSSSPSRSPSPSASPSATRSPAPISTVTRSPSVLPTSTPTSTPTPTPTLSTGISDMCSTARSLVCEETVYASISTATAADPDSLNDGVPDHWYVLSGTGSRVSAHTCNRFTNFNTLLEVHTGECSSSRQLTYNDNDSSCTTVYQASNASWDTTLGTQYRIRARPLFATTITGNYALTLTCGAPLSSSAPISTPTRSPSVSASMTPASTTPSPSISLEPSDTPSQQASHAPTASKSATPSASPSLQPLAPTASPTSSPGILTVVNPGSCTASIPVVCGTTIYGSLAAKARHWYYLAGPGKTVSLSTCSSLTLMDTSIQVTTGSCSSLRSVENNLDQVADSECSKMPEFEHKSYVKWPGLSGTSYRIQVKAVDSSKGGNYSLTISCSGIALPSPTPLPTLTAGDPDMCAAPTVVFCNSTIYGSLENASSVDPDILNDYSKDHWYLLRISDAQSLGNNIMATTCSSLSTFDTWLEVYSGTCNDVSLVAYNDDMNELCSVGPMYGRNAMVSWSNVPNVAYRIRVVPFSNGAVGRYALRITC